MIKSIIISVVFILFSAHNSCYSQIERNSPYTIGENSFRLGDSIFDYSEHLSYVVTLEKGYVKYKCEDCDSKSKYSNGVEFDDIYLSFLNKELSIICLSKFYIINSDSVKESFKGDFALIFSSLSDTYGGNNENNIIENTTYYFWNFNNAYITLSWCEDVMKEWIRFDFLISQKHIK
jgi:hypothetical protein